MEVFEARTSPDKVSPDRQADRPQVRQGFFEGKVFPHPLRLSLLDGATTATFWSVKKQKTAG